MGTFIDIVVHLIALILTISLPAYVVWLSMEKKVAELQKQLNSKQSLPAKGFSYMLAPDNILIVPMTIKFPDGLTIIHQDGVRETDKLEVLTLTRIGK